MPLSSAPKHKKVQCTYGEVSVLGKLHLGMSYNAIDFEFTVDESTMWHK